jgi:hypothetical protein
MKVPQKSSKPENLWETIAKLFTNKISKKKCNFLERSVCTYELNSSQKFGDVYNSMKVFNNNCKDIISVSFDVICDFYTP